MNLLLVEDDKTVVDSLTPSFKERGFAVEVAFDGDVGLQKAQRDLAYQNHSRGKSSSG